MREDWKGDLTNRILAVLLLLGLWKLSDALEKRTEEKVRAKAVAELTEMCRNGGYISFGDPQFYCMDRSSGNVIYRAN